nr:hypothetical protein DM860_006244 [Ipomoea batatas]
MDVESTFRVMFGVKKEQDMVELIEAAVSVASLIAPHKLKKHRSRIVKLLFDEDPANASHDLFSDDELGFDSDDDDDDELLKVTSTPKKTSHSPEIKKLGFGKKSVEESQVVAPKMPPLKTVGRQEKSIRKQQEHNKQPHNQNEGSKHEEDGGFHGAKHTISVERKMSSYSFSTFSTPLIFFRARKPSSFLPRSIKLVGVSTMIREPKPRKMEGTRATPRDTLQALERIYLEDK